MGAVFFTIHTNALINNHIMDTKNSEKAVRLQMVEIDHKRFAAEILKDNARINLTQMAKPFGKLVKDWLKTDETKAYLEIIAKRRKILLADLVEVRKGGTPGTSGTWCNDRHIAIRFAQWLNAEFAIAVDDAILRLMLGEAVYAEPINGVEPVIFANRAWYNYGDAMQSFGCKRSSGMTRRKNAMPQCFQMIYGRNFITKECFLAMKSYYDWKARYKQLELPFDFEDANME